MVEKVGVDASCQTDPELSPEKQIKYRKMKRKLATLIHRQKQLKGLLSAAQRRKLALAEKKDTKSHDKAVKSEPMDTSDREEAQEVKLEVQEDNSEGSDQEYSNGGDV